MAIDCPDNSTECLLRALITTTATQQSPWEPRSFGFTVAIGVAAFLISFVAIFQGLLAAGPGRIKASQNAIGNFGKLSKGRLSLIEFAWRSTAKVPVLKFEELLIYILDQKEVGAEDHGIDFPFRAGNSTTGATWLQLLRCVDLSEDIEHTFPEPSLQECATDYLPADIQAPPAAAQLRCLAILAAIADPTVKIDPSGKSFCIGKTSLVSFREHPVLGTLAAYEHYQSERSRTQQMFDAAHNFYKTPASYATYGRCTKLALELAEGTFGMNWRTKQDTSEKGLFSMLFVTACSPEREGHVYKWYDQEDPNYLTQSKDPWARAIALMVARTDYEPRPFPWNRSGLRDAVSYLKQLNPDMFQNEEAMTRWLSKSGCETEVERKYNDRDRGQDLAFEKFGSWVIPGYQHFLGGDFGPGIAAALCELCNQFFEQLDAGVRYQAQSGDSAKDYGESIEITWTALKQVDVLLRLKRRPAIDALNALTSVLVQKHDPAKSAVVTAAQSPRSNGTTAPAGQSAGDQSPVPAQTQSVSAAASRSSGSSSDTNTLASHSTGLHSNGPRRSGDSHTTHPTVTLRTSTTEQQSLEALLIVRAVLFAKLLEAGPDTSVLFEPNFRNSIIRVM
ncbi:hypothetical protein PMZ80_009166 [Knufia obscura]|uniref:Uncharacterized protein n=1 Tax=Knufia obscura TaxID=1635080 RepID=A0ABR0RFE6_9EURO|nr:hypothetical protein PMZ80_009166 [Knufia obscura]